MYKMYFLVLYNLSPIQQGIQAWHSAIEYMLKYNDEETKERATSHKTFIILNWGTTETLEQHRRHIDGLWIKHTIFCEPDLWGLTTSPCFIAKDGDSISKYFTPLFRLA